MLTKILERYHALYDQAKSTARKNVDGSVPEAEMILQLKCLVTIDEDAQRERKAKEIINALCKRDSQGSIGQLCFPDFGTWDWDPARLIRSDNGDLIENISATLKFKVADTQRSEHHTERAHASSRRKRHEVDVFTEWTIQKLEAGFAASKLTWGRCVEELGLHDPLAPSAGAEDAEDDSE